ncbi:MAG: hypothetical protein II777_04125 [Clostridia bacterium]|nr:hypothetical protein [Clostridia bacterium]
MKRFLIVVITCAALLRSCLGLPVSPAATETEAQTFAMPEKAVDVPLYGEYRYAYGTLDESQKPLYGKIRDGALAFKPYIEIDDANEASYVYQAVFFDHPELFFITEKPKIEEGRLYYNYVFTSEQIEDTVEALDAAYGKFVSEQITDGMSEFEKFFTVYTYLINITKYADEEYELYEKGSFTYEVYRKMSAAGPLCDSRAICTGYARATQYLCQRLGIKCFTVNGFGNEGDHYFNVVNLDGDWYYSDTTWGDPVGSDRSIDYLTYYYFCTTTEETLRTHKVYSVIPMPECTAVKYNYYVYFDLYAENAEEAGAKLCREYQKGLRSLSVKTPYGEKGEEIYRTLKDGFLYAYSADLGISVGPYRLSYNKETQIIVIRF